MAMARAAKSAANFLPDELSLPTLREAAAGCKGCELVPLAAIAAQSLLGQAFRVTQNRRRLIEPELAAIVGDLRFVASLL
jgi:hypothetical protein